MGPRRINVASWRAAGFTVVELVTVILIVGILSALAGPRFFARAEFDARGYYDEVAASLRYAQKLAVATGCPVRFRLAGGNYDLAQQAALGNHCNPADAGFTTVVQLPDGENAAGSAPAGIAAGPDIQLFYDAAGRVSAGGDTVINVGARTITVRGGSGYVIAP